MSEASPGEGGPAVDLRALSMDDEGDRALLLAVVREVLDDERVRATRAGREAAEACEALLGSLETGRPSEVAVLVQQAEARRPGVDLYGALWGLLYAWRQGDRVAAEACLASVADQLAALLLAAGQRSLAERVAGPEQVRRAEIQAKEMLGRIVERHSSGSFKTPR